jgi:hypothetical protein
MGVPMARNRERRRPRPDTGASAVLDRRTRALEESLDVHLGSNEPYPLLEVRNPIHGTAYSVLLPGRPGNEVALCTCTDFARRGLGTCKHIEAATRWLAEHPDAPPLRARPPIEVRRDAWAAIDRRGRGTPPEDGLLRWMRRAGAALYLPE